RSITHDGFINLLASSPSLVNSSKPLVLKSRRPTEIQRSPFNGGRLSYTVRRPSGSEREQISPSGLLYKITRRREVSGRVATRRPLKKILSSAPTLSPSLATRSFTFTLPASMARSISRRDPKPARASTFCSFSSVDVFSINPASDLSKLSDWAGFCASFFSGRFSERCSSRFSGRAGLPDFTGSDENRVL